jgi:hypothetical protein
LFDKKGAKELQVCVNPIQGLTKKITSTITQVEVFFIIATAPATAASIIVSNLHDRLMFLV